MKKKVRTAGGVFIIIAAAMCGRAGAGLVEILPESSHYQGHVFYDELTDAGFLRGRIDFAVYDTQTYPDEFIGADDFEIPGEGRYIYAYQVFNDLVASDEPVAYFAVLGIEPGTINGISSQDDNQGGMDPTSAYTEDSRGVWEFDGGMIYSTGHSMFLVFSSQNDWTPGSYEIRTAESDDFPSPSVPEPSVIALLGSGLSVLLLGKRRSRRLRYS